MYRFLGNLKEKRRLKSGDSPIDGGLILYLTGSQNVAFRLSSSQRAADSGSISAIP